MNQQIQTQSETVPGTFRNTNVENQGTNEDESQSDPHPEVGSSVCQSRHSIDSDTGEAHDTMTGVIERTTKDPHSSIDMKPNHVQNSDFLSKLYSKPFREYKKPKVGIGDRVRISKYELPFRTG